MIRMYNKLSFLCFFLFCLFFSFTSSSSPCSNTFSERSPDQQLKDRLLLIAGHRQSALQEVTVTSCEGNCMTVSSQTELWFQVKTDPALFHPRIILSASTKTLMLPNWSYLQKGSLDSYLKRWLVGHEAHPHTTPVFSTGASGSGTLGSGASGSGVSGSGTSFTIAQGLALEAVRQALRDRVRSFLHISPTATGKSLVLARALKGKLMESPLVNKISLVMAHQIHLVDQLYDVVREELGNGGVFVLNWNEYFNERFVSEVKKAVLQLEPTVFVITSQSLKSQLSFFEREGTGCLQAVGGTYRWHLPG